eukprot:2456982-Prymnesium_polylepis.1
MAAPPSPREAAPSAHWPVGPGRYREANGLGHVRAAIGRLSGRAVPSPSPSPNTLQWAACRGWSASARGYPCGLWLLFHSLLARAPDHAALGVLAAIEGYVRHFFGCADCAAHFLQMAEGADDPLPRRRPAAEGAAADGGAA